MLNSASQCPQFDMKHGQNSRKHLHHLTIWECTGDPNSAAYRQGRERLMHYASQQGHECYSSSMPLDYNSCNNPVIVWATGGEVSATEILLGYHSISHRHQLQAVMII